MAMTKRQKAIKTAVEPGKSYAIDEALKIVQGNSKAKFVEAVDVAVRLGVDAKKSDQQVRGSTVLPAGTGKSVRVAVFAPAGAKADEARAAGAEAVGMDDLAEAMQAGDLNYDVVIATPDAMRVVGKLGQVLGPRGLMPNPKVGTVSPNPAEAVRNAKAGQVRYRTDKAGIIHCTIGKASFEAEALKGNLTALLLDLIKAKPSTGEGPVPAEDLAELDHGPGRDRRPVDADPEVIVTTRLLRRARATSFEGIAPQGATPSKTAGAVRAMRRRAGSSVRHGVVFVEGGNA
jgi:large subunit ribosomal protein L1